MTEEGLYKLCLKKAEEQQKGAWTMSEQKAAREAAYTAFDKAENFGFESSGKRTGREIKNNAIDAAIDAYLAATLKDVDARVGEIKKRYHSARAFHTQAEIDCGSLLDNIITLTARLKEVEGALEPFAETAALIPAGWQDDHGLGDWALSLDVGDLRRAAALSPSTEKASK